jgi:2-hydroxy-3-oxopropionate reductase
MLQGSFEAGFRARLHQKDARIVLDLAHDVEAPVPSFEVVARQLDKLVRDGGGDLDHSALYRALNE